MSANVYAVEDLLKYIPYISRTLRGEIVSVEEHPHAVYYEGCKTFLVEVKPQHGFKNTYRTVAVRV